MAESMEQRIVESQVQKTDLLLAAAKPSITPLEERLEKLPGLIYTQMRQISDVSTELSDVKTAIETIERKEYLKIDSETDEKGKKKFSNEKARQAELLRRLKHNEPYQKLKEKEQSLHERLESLKLDLAFLRDFFSATKWLVQLKTGAREEEP